MELTLRTDAALDVFERFAKVPEMLAGIGTILTTQQIDEVVGAEAAFGVAPGLNRRVVEYAQDRGLPATQASLRLATLSKVSNSVADLEILPAETSGA